jgi:hypothetical protein
VTLDPSLQKLIERLPPAAELDIFKLLEAIYETRLTARVSFDFHNGVPRQVDLGPPVRLAICQGLPMGHPAGATAESNGKGRRRG